MQKNRYSQSSYRNIGFTLIELLIVVTILSVVGAVTFFSLYGRRNATDLSGVSAQIVATLHEAQSRSMTQMQGVSWGVHFANPTNTSPFYALFSSAYGPTTTAGSYALPSSVGYLVSTVPLGGSVDVMFSQVSGLVSTPATIGLFALNANKKASATSSVVSVASNGAIFVFSTVPSSSAPVVSSLNPSSAVVGSSQFTLTVSGLNFSATSTVQWNGASLATTYVSSTSITAIVPAVNLTTTGTPSVTVINPGYSNAMSFSITNPVPTLTVISPNSATIGGSQFTLTLTGTNFVNGSIVNWNGSALATTYVSGTGLTAIVPAANIVSAGTATVTVTNPTPGGGTSGGQTFTINNPVPTLTSISPTSTLAGGSQFTLTVTGTNFVNGATVKWNGSALATTYVSGTGLTATVPAANIVSGGTATVTVTNAAPGGGTSGGQTFTIIALNPVPTLTLINPTSTTAGGSQFTLTVTGTNFVNSATVKWNGSALATTYVSATSLTAIVPAINIASAGTDPITVTNPTPGGGTSGSVTFTAIANAAPNAPSEDSPLNNTTGTPINPVFKMTAIDPNGDILKYKVTIYSNNICTTVVQTNDETASQAGWSGQNASSSSAFTSGTQGTFTTQTALTAGTTYYWEASAIDPWGSNTWTDSATCNQFTTAAPLNFTTGDAAADMLGQYDDSMTNPFYTKGGSNNGPNGFGLSGSRSALVDSTNHRMFVTDYSNNRVLVYSLDASDNFNSATSSYVLGQLNDLTNGYGAAQSKMYAPIGLAYDATRNYLFVSETSNNRVTVWNVNPATIATGENASYVLGQSTFTFSAAAATASGLSGPRGLTYDATRNYLFVADYYNNRVSVFNVSTITNGQAAINVIGQSGWGLTAASSSSSGLSGPSGVAYDATTQRLFVGDYTNNRVPVFDVSTITNGQAAINVIGQSGWGLTGGASTATSTYNPYGVDIDPSTQRLFVAEYTNSRVSVWNVATSSIADGEAASFALGQATLTGHSLLTTQTGLYYPYGAEFDAAAQKLFVDDTGNNRIVIFSTATLATGEAASGLLGQYDDSMTNPIYTKGSANNGPSKFGFNAPRSTLVDSTNHRMFVTDYSNNRVLVYSLDTNDDFNSVMPSYILGQPNDLTNGSAATQSKMYTPVGLAYDPARNYLFVGEYANRRVTVWNVNPATIATGENASYVLGQANFTGSSAATTASGFGGAFGLAYDPVRSYLFVADYTNNRVSVFDVSTITNGQAAINVLGQSGWGLTATSLTSAGMNGPYGVAYDGTTQRLFVADFTNNRVSVFDVSTITDGEAAINVLGQAGWGLAVGAANTTTMWNPYGLDVDPSTQRLFVAENNNSRVSIWNVATSSITDGEALSIVLGQPTFTARQLTNTQSGISNPDGVEFDAAAQKLFVTDTGGSRIMMFNEH